MRDYREQAKTELDIMLDIYYMNEEKQKIMKEQILQLFREGSTSNNYTYMKDTMVTDRKLAEETIARYRLDVPTITTKKTNWRNEKMVEIAFQVQLNMALPKMMKSGYFRRVKK